jgi:hypothetical protein
MIHFKITRRNWRLSAHRNGERLRRWHQIWSSHIIHTQQILWSSLQKFTLFSLAYGVLWSHQVFKMSFEFLEGDFPSYMEMTGFHICLSKPTSWARAGPRGANREPDPASEGLGGPECLFCLSPSCAFPCTMETPHLPDMHALLPPSNRSLMTFLRDADSPLQPASLDGKAQAGHQRQGIQRTAVS